MIILLILMNVLLILVRIKIYVYFTYYLFNDVVCCFLFLYFSFEKIIG